MKFGFRSTSITSRIAARTSIKRQVVHRLGIKAPRGFGWLTDPKKALYNRVYNRTTVDPVKVAEEVITAPTDQARVQIVEETVKKVAIGMLIAAAFAALKAIADSFLGGGRRR